MKDATFTTDLTELDFNIEADQETASEYVVHPDPLDVMIDDGVHALDFANVKTPDQIPDKVATSHLPESILRSTAMEAVIQQNDDLLARLSVSLRRINGLEEKLKDAMTEANMHRERYENLKDQLLVMKEQAKRLAGKNNEATEIRRKDEQSTQDLKEQIRVFEIRYAELFQASRSHRQKLEAETDRYTRFAARHTKYRRNIRRAVAVTREELQMLKDKRAAQEMIISDLRINLSETANYVTEQGQNHKRELRDLTTAYETQVKALDGEIQMLVEQNKTLGLRAGEFDRLQNERYRLENEIVVSKRREDEMRSRYESELNELQVQLGHYRGESIQLAVDLTTRTEHLTTATQLVEELQIEKKAFVEQTETLQALWRDQQAKIESLTEQKISLQKLNQELSRTVNKQRLELREINEKIEFETQRFAQEIKLRETENALLKKTETTVEATPKPSAAQVALNEKSQALLQKIDEALSNIHS